jgi:hypothetical protein
MRAVAGAILILSATILVSAVLIASRLGTHNQDDGTFNLVALGGAFALGLFGLMVLLTGLGNERPPRTVPRPPA